MKWIVQIVFITLITVAGQGAWAEKPDREKPKMILDMDKPVYKLNLAADLTSFLIGGMLAVGWVLGDELGPSYCAPLCDKKDVNDFDRFAAGNYNENWSLATDITLGSTLAVGIVALFADHKSVAGFSDFVVVAESVLFGNAFVILANLATRRPRPYMYSDKAPEDVRNSGTASLSFPSGHVSAAAAMTTSVFSVLYARHPKSPWTWVFLGFGTAATGAVATGRVLAGRHFLSDVLVGATVGACMGFLVPALHKKNMKVMPLATGDTAGLAISGMF